MAGELTVGKWSVFPELNNLVCDGVTVHIEPKIMQVLITLAERPGEVIPKEHIFQRVWAGTFVSDDVLTRSISELRRIFQDNPREPSYIQTIPKGGYRLVAPVSNGTVGRVGPTSRTSWQRNAWMGAMVIIVLVALGTTYVVRRAKDSVSPPKIASLAVLPLANLSGDPAQDYFADGMTEQIITDLGQIGSLRVISRTSVMGYKNTHKSLQQIAGELHVDALLEGAVLRSGDQVRITTQLIPAPGDKVLWAKSYDGDLSDILMLQDEVAKSVASQINAQLRPHTARSIDPDAYEAYLMGIAQDWTVDGSQRRIKYLEKAIALQPDYADAYCELADTYVNLGHMLVLPPQQAFPKAKIAAQKALEFDDTLAQAHATMADVKLLYDWDFDSAQKEIQRAVELGPNSSLVISSHMQILTIQGRYDESIALAKRMEEIDPLSSAVATNVIVQLYFARRYDEAIAQAHKVLTDNPNKYSTHLFLGLSLEQKHLYREAITELQKAVELSNEKAWVFFVAHAKASSGDQIGARKILQDMELLSHHTYVSPWWFAMVYPDLGEQDLAFFWLEKAYNGREHDLVFSNVWPMFDMLRPDPRYKDLLKRIGLPEVSSKVSAN